jgi:DNA-binding NtrC family response regulator
LDGPYGEPDGKRVLLVEADPWIRDSLSMFFWVRGCRLQSAACGKEAVAALRGDRFDLILCEDRLPDMDGLTFLKMSGDSHPEAVRFLMTGYPRHEVVEEAARSGIREVIRKPFTTEVLEESLRRIGESRPRGEEAAEK